MNKMWKPEKHPCHFVSKSDKHLVDRFFETHNVLAPMEMFRTLQNRTAPMIYMSDTELNHAFWSFLHEWRKKHSWWYRFRTGDWKLLK